MHAPRSIACLLLLTCAFGGDAHGQDRGVISDPDGYVNVRRSKSTSAPVVAKVKENEPFTFEAVEDSEWCKVTLRSGKTGWMHRSRIRLYFTEADLPQKPKPDEGISEIDEHAKSVAGVDYHILARKAARGDLDAQKKFFGLAESVDGAAAESYTSDLTTMVHVLGDQKLAAFLAQQPLTFLTMLRGSILSSIEMAGMPSDYAKRHFPKTTALFVRAQLDVWVSPDGRFTIRKSFSDPEDLNISKVSRAELIEKATGKVLLDLTPDDIGVGGQREGEVLWSPDSKRFAYLSMDLRVGQGNLFSAPPLPTTRKQTTVYQDAGNGFVKVDLQPIEPPDKKDDPELKDAKTGHEFVEPIEWQKPDVLILQRHHYYEALNPDRTIKSFGRLWMGTVRFTAEGKAEVTWKRDDR